MHTKTTGRRRWSCRAATFAAVLFLTQAHASESSDLTAQLAGLQSERGGLIAERVELKKKQDNLDWAAQQLRPKIDKFEAEFKAHEKIRSAHDERVLVHNNRCAGESSDEGFVAACNGEAAQLNAENANLDKKSAALEQTRQLLLENVQTHETQQTLTQTADAKAAERLAEIDESVTKILTRLKEIAIGNDHCKDAIAEVDAHPGDTTYLENMHAACREMFDGG